MVIFLFLILYGSSAHAFSTHLCFPTKIEISVWFLKLFNKSHPRLQFFTAKNENRPENNMRSIPMSSWQQSGPENTKNLKKLLHNECIQNLDCELKTLHEYGLYHGCASSEEIIYEKIDKEISEIFSNNTALDYIDALSLKKQIIHECLMPLIQQMRSVFLQQKNTTENTHQKINHKDNSEKDHDEIIAIIQDEGEMRDKIFKSTHGVLKAVHSFRNYLFNCDDSFDDWNMGKAYKKSNSSLNYEEKVKIFSLESQLIKNYVELINNSPLNQIHTFSDKNLIKKMSYGEAITIIKYGLKNILATNYREKINSFEQYPIGEIIKKIDNGTPLSKNDLEKIQHYFLQEREYLQQKTIDSNYIYHKKIALDEIKLHNEESDIIRLYEANHIILTEELEKLQILNNYLNTYMFSIFQHVKLFYDVK